MIIISNIERTRFGFYLVEPVGLHDALKYGVKAEEYGFDLVAACDNLFWWTPGQAPVWNSFAVLTTIMNKTKKIEVMTNVIDSVKYHPAIVAHMVSTLDNISNGRFQLGVGGGEIGNFGPLVDQAGSRPYRLLTRLKEFVTVLQGVWKSTIENPFSFDGTFFHVKDGFLTSKPFTKPHPPIYLSALGPKMRKFAGHVADGWIPITYTPESYKKDLKEIESSAKTSGRDVKKIDPGLTIYTIVLKDHERAKEIAAARGKLDLAARPRLLRDLGYKEIADENLMWSRRPGPLMGEYPKESEYASKIPTDLASEVTISGSPDEAIGQIEKFIKSGVKLFVLWQPYEEKDALEETVENYKNIVIPYFAGR